MQSRDGVNHLSLVGDAPLFDDKLLGDRVRGRGPTLTSEVLETAYTYTPWWVNSSRWTRGPRLAGLVVWRPPGDREILRLFTESERS